MADITVEQIEELVAAMTQLQRLLGALPTRFMSLVVDDARLELLLGGAPHVIEALQREYHREAPKEGESVRVTFNDDRVPMAEIVIEAWN